MYAATRVLSLCVLCLHVVNCNPSGDLVTGVDDSVVVYASSSSNVVLNCSLPLPVVWYKNNIPVPDSSRQAINILTGSLTFTPIFPSQSGWYSCATTTGSNRTVQDHVLIVGDAPSVKQTEDPLSYGVVEGTRVVLGCLVSGYPPPQVIWRNGFDMPVVESDGVSVSPVSNELIIDRFTETHTQAGGYYCELTNALGTFNSTPTTVTLTNNTLIPLYKSPLEGLSSPHYIPPSANTTLRLRCTGLNLESTNLTVSWFKDYSLLGKTNDRLSIFEPSTVSSGYYCCNVNYMNGQVNRHCVSVWMGSAPELSPILPPTTLALSSNREPLLPCVASLSTSTPRYDTPLVTWERDNETVGEGMYGVNFVRVSREGVYTCTLTNNVSSVSASVSITLVELCAGVNIVVGGDANNVSAWNTSNSNGRLDTLNNEQVFVVDYSLNDTNLSQTISEQIQVIGLHISGRVRQTTSLLSERGQATMILTTSRESVVVINPDTESQAWQWVAFKKNFTEPVILESIQLFVKDGVSGVAYFDDVCVSVTLMTEESILLRAIVGGVVGGVVLILLLAVGVIVGVVCCGSRGKKQASLMMKKMSFKMTKQSASEGVGGVSLQGYSDDTVNRVYDSIRREGDYSNPDSIRREEDYSNADNYQYINPHEVPGPPSKSPDPSNSDGQYTSLNPQLLDNHMYMTTTPSRSLASLHDKADATEAMAAGYLQVLPSSLPLNNIVYDNSSIRERCVTSPTELQNQYDSNLYESV